MPNNEICNFKYYAIVAIIQKSVYNYGVNFFEWAPEQGGFKYAIY